MILLCIISALTWPVHAQTVADSFGALQGILIPGQMVVVTDQARRETKGTVTDISVSELTLALDGTPAQRTFSDREVYTIRRTDPLGNGTQLGVLVGAAPAIALLASCERYQYSEESDLCVAGAVIGLVIGVPIGALIGRAVDSAVGNQEIFYRPPRSPQAGVVLTPLISNKGFGALISVSF